MQIHIIPYQSKYQPEFKLLNLEWLDKFNLTEDRDLEVLDDPQGMILDQGGFLWLAQAGEEIIGSAGLIKEHEGVFELAKMSVSPDWRGKGISKLLLDVCVAKAKELGLQKLILFSNHQLVTALKLYEKYGFRHVEVTDTPFETADVKMELEL
jgi:putative acetyltransferase